MALSVKDTREKYIKYFIRTVLVVLLSTQLVANERLTVLTEEYPPFNFSEQGEVTGFSTEIVHQLLKMTGNDEVEIEIYPWERAYLEAQKQPNVLLYTTVRTEKREKQFKWVGPIEHRTIWIWKLKERENIQIETLEDAKNYKFSIVPKSAGSLFLVDQGFSEAQLDYMPLDSLTMATFLMGRNEFVLKMEMAMAFSLAQLGKPMDLVEPVFQLPSNEDYYLAFSLGTPDHVVSSFQQALDEIKENGIYEAIRFKWTASMGRL